MTNHVVTGELRATVICAAALDKRDTYSDTSRVAENGVAVILCLAMFL